MNPKQHKPNAIEKALDILMAFVPHNEPMGTTEISKKLELHNATASRTLLLLTKRKFLRQDPHTKKFRLSRSALDIGLAVTHSLTTDLVNIAKPHIDQLRHELKETIVFEQLIRKHTVMVYIAEGPQRVRIAGTVGDRLPINAAAGAKAIMAYSDPETVQSLVNGKSDFVRYTPHTITDPDSLMRQLEDIRRQGFAADLEEIDIGINAVAAPVFNYENTPVAAVVVAGPSNRVRSDDSELIAKIGKVAKTISANLHNEAGV
jgi:DNA-binding IclR family transcriptional regulator